MTDQTSTPTAQATVTGTIRYQLSEAGQRAALAAGLPAQRDQIIEAQIPVDLLPHCAVSPDGHPTLDLSAEWPVATHLDATEDMVVKPIRAAYGYDYCTRVHLMDRPLLDPIAAFLAARVLAQDEAQTKQRAVEQHRSDLIEHRRRRDEQADADRRERAAKAEAEQRAIQERQAARRAAIDAWIGEHGTENQRARWAAGMLPESELLEAMADQVFAAVTAPRFAEITVEDCLGTYSDDDYPPEVTDEMPYCTSKDATEATAAQWDALQAVRAQLPTEAAVKLRVHVCGLVSSDDPEHDVVRYGIHVKLHVGPIGLVREFAAPDA